MRPAAVPDPLRREPFTRHTAHAAGVSDAALQSKPWRQVFRGVWVHESLPDTRELRLGAARLVVPARGVLCGLTAAWVHGADVRRLDDLDVHVSFPPGMRIRSRRGLVVTQEALNPDDVGLAAGVHVTVPTRTAYDCLRLLRHTDAVVVADALTHLRRTTVEAVRAYFDSQRRMRNLRIGRRRLDEVEPLAESPMESRLRLGLTGGGLPRPVAQFVVYDALGCFVARVDLAYPELKIAVEYDGAWHWQNRRDDDRRRDALRALGWIVIVVSAEDLYAGRDRVIAQVRSARRSRGAA